MKRKHQNVVLAVGIVLTVTGAALLFWPGGPHLYRTTILPVLPGHRMSPRALNDRGQVVGLTMTGAGAWHLFVWDRQNGAQDLGPAGLDDCDINNRGQVLGMGSKAGVPCPFVRDPNGTVRFLDIPGGEPCQARAINDRGQVVGSFQAPPRYTTHAFIWSRSEGLQDLGRALNRSSAATAVSETGTVFGFYEYSEGMRHYRKPVYWNPDDPFDTAGIETPSNDFFDMNDKGWIVGRHTFMKDGPHVVLWNAYGGIQKLFPYDPPLGIFGQASDWLVNDVNQVVYTEEYHSRWEKYSARLFPPRHDCTLWDPVHGRIALKRYLPSQTQRFEVRDLNNRGGILGIAHLKGGRLQLPVLLEPIAERL